jgi:hypothetical protein
MTDPRNAREDRGLERLLRESLPPADAGDAAACLDADMMAAWLDDSLTADERTTAEAHAAGCARCQSMLAVMVRTAPAADAAVQGAPIRRWTMMLAPALAAAAAVTLWFAIERPQQSITSGPAGTETAASAAGEPPAFPALPPTSSRSPADEPMTQAAKKEAELMLTDALRKNDEREQRSRDRSRAAGLRRAQDEKSLDKFDSDAQPTAPKTLADTRSASVAGTATTVTPLPAAPPAAAPAAPAPGAAAETVTVVQSPAVESKPVDERQRQAPPMQSPNQYTQPQAAQQRPDQQQSAGVAARDTAQAQERTEKDLGAGRGGVAESVALRAVRSAGEATDTIAFRSPDGTHWWRITGGRVAQVSDDKGATWSTRYAADEKTSLTAGSAASATVVWIVGRGGAIFVTADAITWRRVAFPERVDLNAVVALDARRATVNTADGRSFTTADAGATWTRK